MDVEGIPIRKLFEKIYTRYGYDFTNYAPDSLTKRSMLFMHNLRIGSWEAFGALVLNDENTFTQFIRFISVTVTEMFRDPFFYSILREQVLQQLHNHSAIRLWVAGCATGEEAYSMAILLKEENLLDRSIIYATDINQHSLMVAKEGIYPISSLRTYTSNYLKAGGKNSFSEYYTAKYDLVSIDRSLRQNIVFAPHNLAVDHGFNEFQLIVCRNVLIYFNSILQERVINLFYESLSPKAFLGLGSNESLTFSSKKNFFTQVPGKEKIYMKK